VTNRELVVVDEVFLETVTSYSQMPELDQWGYFTDVLHFLGYSAHLLNPFLNKSNDNI